MNTKVRWLSETVLVKQGNYYVPQIFLSAEMVCEGIKNDRLDNTNLFRNHDVGMDIDRSGNFDIQEF